MLEDKEMLSQITRFEVTLDAVQERSKNIETQVEAIKEIIKNEIVKEIQSLALDIREIRVMRNNDETRIKVIEDRMNALEKDQQAQARKKSDTWLQAVVNVIVGAIGAILGGVFFK